MNNNLISLFYFNPMTPKGENVEMSPGLAPRQPQRRLGRNTPHHGFNPFPSSVGMFTHFHDKCWTIFRQWELLTCVKTPSSYPSSAYEHT